jgi:ATP-dependent helicase/nuclease subunit A
MGNIKVIKASAGSGKTYQLTKEYIEMMLGHKTAGGKLKLRGNPDYYEHILAITFTNKATDEMKARIVTQLYELSKGGGDYYDDFKNVFVDNINDVVKAAGVTLKHILFNYTKFNVSTIDSFFQTIMRTFARELDRDYNYDIQLEEDFAINVALHNFLLDLSLDRNQKGSYDNWVKSYIKENVTRAKSWNFFSNNDDFFNFAKTIKSEAFIKYHKAIIDYLDDLGSNGPSRIAKFKQLIIEWRNAYRDDYIKKQGGLTAILNKYGYNDPDVKKTLAILTATAWNGLGKPNEDNVKKPTDGMYTLTDNAAIQNIFKVSCKNIPLNLSNEILVFITAYLKDWNCWHALDNLVGNLGFLGLLGQIDSKLEDYRKDTNSLLMSDTNELISKVVESGVDFIYERIGTWINHYMIDEFQDTSRKQYENFKPLLENSIADGNGNLVIGDEKQSIYRFRNADPNLLLHQLQDDFNNNYDGSSLGDNYRSSEQIVNFNNALFTTIPEHYCNNDCNTLQDTYHSVVQKCTKSAAGYVEMNFLDKEKNIVNTDNGDVEISNDELILKEIPKRINDLISRGYEMKDIAILVNKRSEGNDVVSKILEYNDGLAVNEQSKRIEVISAESLLMMNAASVRVIISVLRYIDATQYTSSEDDNEDDDVKAKFIEKQRREQRMFKVLREFENTLSDSNVDDYGTELAKCFAANPLSSFDGKTAELSDFMDILPKKGHELMSLTNIVDKIVDKYLSGSNGGAKKENAFIMAFQDCVAGFCAKRNGGTVREFLKYWDDNKESLAVSSPNDANAVNVMTIHKSKGLQFKCVIIPFLDWGMVRLDSLIWLSKDEWNDKYDELVPECYKGKKIEDIVPPIIPLSDSALKRLAMFSGHYNQITEDSLIDNLNKMYVAFTRPERELCVYAISKVKGESWNNAGDMLSAAINTMNDVEGLPIVKEFNADGQLVKATVGDKTVQKSQSAGSGNVAADGLPAYAVYSNLDKVKIKLPLNPDSSRERGNALHRLFSSIRFRRDAKNALAAYKNRREHRDDEISYQDVEKTVNGMFDNESTKDWFADDNKVYNERVISFKNHDNIENRRPDRIVKCKNGKVIVVDYKFGNEEDDKYKEQVHAYMNLLKDAGENDVSGYLWYVRPNKVVKVD